MWTFLSRLDSEGAVLVVVVVDDDVRFLVTRFAAARICLATFSSRKTDWIAGKGALERFSGLRSDCKPLSGRGERQCRLTL